MNLTNEQKDAIHKKLLGFGEAYYASQAALMKGETEKFDAFIAIEVGVGRDFITFLESLL